jgi:hypothetical protein
MMRKYGLDETQAYVEQSTLLEPNNFIPSWVISNKIPILIKFHIQFFKIIINQKAFIELSLISIHLIFKFDFKEIIKLK